MNGQTDTGEEIELAGKSGQRYTGRIYAHDTIRCDLQGKAIACLSNSEYADEGWIHRVNSIYDTDDVGAELVRFGHRNDISHLILLPYHRNSNAVTDKVDDLIRSYLHS